MKPTIENLNKRNHPGHMYRSEDIIAVGRAANHADGFKYLQEKALESGMLLPQASTLEIRNGVFSKSDGSAIVAADYKLGDKDEIIFEVGDIPNFADGGVNAYMINSMLAQHFQTYALLKSANINPMPTVKFLFPFNLGNAHWNSGVIEIQDNGGVPTANAYSIDPFGRFNKIPDLPLANINALLKAQGGLEVKSVTPQGAIAQIQKGGVACGAYTAEGIRNLKKGKDFANVWDGVLDDQNLREAQNQLILNAVDHDKAIVPQNFCQHGLVRIIGTAPTDSKKKPQHKNLENLGILARIMSFTMEQAEAEAEAEDVQNAMKLMLKGIKGKDATTVDNFLTKTLADNPSKTLSLLCTVFKSETAPTLADFGFIEVTATIFENVEEKDIATVMSDIEKLEQWAKLKKQGKSGDAEKIVGSIDCAALKDFATTPTTSKSASSQKPKAPKLPEKTKEELHTENLQNFNNPKLYDPTAAQAKKDETEYFLKPYLSLAKEDFSNSDTSKQVSIAPSTLSIKKQNPGKSGNDSTYFYTSFRGLAFAESATDTKKIFNDADLFMANFAKCDFKGIDFSKVENLHTVQFAKCNFENCIFPENFILKKAQFKECTGEVLADLDSGFSTSHDRTRIPSKSPAPKGATLLDLSQINLAPAL